MKTPSNKIKDRAEFYRQAGTSIEDIIADTVESCALLCDRHSEEMNAFCFKGKAETAHTCAGIMKEAYGLSHTIVERD